MKKNIYQDIVYKYLKQELTQQKLKEIKAIEKICKHLNINKNSYVYSKMITNSNSVLKNFALEVCKQL